MGRVLLMAAAALAGLCGCSPALCTTCASVAGNWVETTQYSSAACSDGSVLTWSGDSDALQSLAQAGSALTLDGASGMAGVLHSDLSASFGPIPATANPVPVDTDGGDQSGFPEPGKLYLDGWFSGDPKETASFQGTYVFIATVNGCEIDANTSWVRGL